jgi:cellulose synthase/poly-beta-1,6-N-acetylglucosamine synthase-like glycosyltransferase
MIASLWISLPLVVALLLALGMILLYLGKLRSAANSAPQLLVNSSNNPPYPSAKISVIIPAYNEADNIAACITAVLESSSESAEWLDVWVVDDQSTDNTLAIAQTLQTTLADPRLQVIAGKPRPVGETWVGKNWACVQAVQQARGDFLLFLDADVRLKPGAISAALEFIQRSQIDLFTCWPTLVCGCLAEWLAQPLIAGILAAGLDFAQINDPHSETVFAVGPFMLFRRTAYEQIGGHQAVASQVVEDVELARLIKQKGLALHCGLGHDLGTLRMYPTGAALWEGWTKNWYLGSQRNLGMTLQTALLIFWICTLPWLAAIALLLKGSLTGFTILDGIAIALAFATILLQYSIRVAIAQLSAIPPRYWWLTGLGGAFVTAIILGSIIKTETGWGWTWRGRSLKEA